MEVWNGDAAAPISADHCSEIARLRAKLAKSQDHATELVLANAALQGAIARLAGQDGLQHFLAYILAEASSAVGSRSAALFVHDPAADTLAMRAFVHQGEPLDVATDSRLTPWRQPVALDDATRPGWDSILKGHHLQGVVGDGTADNVHGWPSARDFHRRMGHTASLCLPLMAGGRALGFLGLDFAESPRLAAERFSLAHALSQHAGLALQLSLLSDEAREAALAREREAAAEERATELARANAALRQAIESLRELDDLQAFLVRVMAAAERVAGAAEAVLFLVDVDRREMQASVFVRSGAVRDIAADPELAAWRGTLTEGHGYDQQVADKLFGAPGYYWVATDDPLMQPASRAWHEAQGHRWVANFPLWRHGRPLGFFGLSFRQVARPSEAKLEMVQVLAQQVTLAFELTRLAAQAEQEARQAATEAERSRLAGEIHDTLAQDFVGVIAHVERTRRTLLAARPGDGEGAALAGGGTGPGDGPDRAGRSPAQHLGVGAASLALWRGPARRVAGPRPAPALRRRPVAGQCSGARSAAAAFSPGRGRTALHRARGAVERSAARGRGGAHRP